MKKIITACALSCLMAVAILAAALPNYAGTWVLDKDKSKDLPPQMAQMGDVQLVVTQDDKTLTEKIGTGDAVAFNLDGSKSKAQFTGRMAGEGTVYLEKKDDGSIVLHTERALNFQGNAVTIKITEVWQLADGGKTLSAKRTVESPRGTQEITLVFNKKS
jgi:hypothetical protein